MLDFDEHLGLKVLISVVFNDILFRLCHHYQRISARSQEV